MDEEMTMRVVSLGLMILALSACGLADVGTSAATAARVQSEQAKQGEQQIKKTEQELEAAARLREAREEKAPGE